jgi:transglutaminase-like putative cysteine protease
MSESEGSDGPEGGGIEYGEVALALAVVTALVVAASLLPGAGLGGTAGEPSERGTPAQTATAQSGGERTGLTPPGALPGGSPSGVSLSQPPERTRIGSTQGFEGEVAQTPQFVVEGPENTYWRQTAYTRYTGSSWASSPRWRAISAGVPNDAQTVDGRAMDYRVTLLVPSSSLPTAWQPSSVRIPNESAGVEASSVGGVRATRRLPADTTYLARSAAPPSDPATLREAGTDYPDRVERRYTQLPETTPERVGAFTDDLTADDATPYEKAVTVRDWLRTKPYSLSASHEAGEPVADQFIFEMESGYCQYYATSMVVMLRTQGIPARYVVGYAPGEQVGSNQYLVTADRGHAWVEVFFPGTGWVRFDPTGSGRLPVQNPQPPYDISLNRSAVAGAPVTISVAKDGEPVIGAPVEINDERVGWTGADGTVTTHLPYAAEFTVTARSPDAETKYDGEASETTGDLWAGGELLPAGYESPSRADGREPIVAQRDRSATNGSSRTYRSDTNVTLTVEGTPVAGGGTTVRATIRDVPVRGATVTLDDERVGTTGPDGRLGVSLADVSPGEHRLAVRREAVGATTTVRVYARDATPPADEPPPLNLSVSAPLVPLPGGSGTVRTTRNGTPVGGAQVTVDGGEAGTTTENGTLGVSFPVTGSAVVVARAPDGASARMTLPLARNAAAVGGVALVGLALVGRAIRRRGVTPRSAGQAATTWLSRLVGWTTAACVRAADIVTAAGRALRRGLRSFAAAPKQLATRGIAAFAVLEPRRIVGWIRRWLAGLLARAGSAAGATGNGEGRAGATTRGDGSETDDGASTATLRGLWREFVGLVAPPRATTRTPGEIARYAVERGLPAEPIHALTEAYRDAEYGRLAPDADRLARAREALRAVREAVRGRTE